MRAATLPGPVELLPGLPDAVIDLQSDRGVQLVRGQWRYHDAQIEEIEASLLRLVPSERNYSR
jgi:hypothetical protein